MPYVAVIALLAVLVSIHKLGHFLAAKPLGLPVARFSLPSAVCGWLVLIAFMVYATANDIVNYLA